MSVICFRISILGSLGLILFVFHPLPVNEGGGTREAERMKKRRIK